MHSPASTRAAASAAVVATALALIFAAPARGAFPTEEISEADAPRPSVAEAFQASTLVVFGQVVRYEHRGKRPVATLRVTDVLKGEPVETLAFYSVKVGCCLPLATLGQTLVVFLEPSGEGEVAWQLVERGGGVLEVARRRGAFLAFRSRWAGVQFPLPLCSQNDPSDQDACWAPLAAVLASAEVPSPKAPKPRDAIFQAGTSTCAPCELSPFLPPTGAGMVDCQAASSDPSDKSHAEAEQCVRAQLAARHPFVVVNPLQGIDSSIVQAVVSDGRTLHQLWYDSSVGGGPKCMAVVRSKRCGRLGFEERGNPWLLCAEAMDEAPKCDQTLSTVETLSPPRDASSLHCLDAAGAVPDYAGCSLTPPPKGEPDFRPDAHGPDLLCSEFLGRLACHPR